MCYDLLCGLGELETYNDFPWAARWTPAASDAANVGTIDPFGRRPQMYPRENEEPLEAIREGLEQGVALRRAVAEGRISEDTAVAAICAPPNRRGEFKAVATNGRKTQDSQKR